MIVIFFEGFMALAETMLLVEIFLLSERGLLELFLSNSGWSVRMRRTEGSYREETWLRILSLMPEFILLTILFPIFNQSSIPSSLDGQNLTLIFSPQDGCPYFITINYIQIYTYL